MVIKLLLNKSSKSPSLLAPQAFHPAPWPPPPSLSRTQKNSTGFGLDISLRNSPTCSSESEQNIVPVGPARGAIPNQLERFQEGETQKPVGSFTDSCKGSGLEPGTQGWPPHSNLGRPTGMIHSHRRCHSASSCGPGLGHAAWPPAYVVPRVLTLFFKLFSLSAESHGSWERDTRRLSGSEAGPGSESGLLSWSPSGYLNMKSESESPGPGSCCGWRRQLPVGTRQRTQARLLLRLGPA